MNCLYSTEPEGNTIWYKTSEFDQSWRRTAQQRVSGTESDWTVASPADWRTHDNRIGKPDTHLSHIQHAARFSVSWVAYRLVYITLLSLLFCNLTSCTHSPHLIYRHLSFSPPLPSYLTYLRLLFTDVPFRASYSTYLLPPKSTAHKPTPFYPTLAYANCPFLHIFFSP